MVRFNKVSIFSDLNNLHDISLSEEYADICGWTEQEMSDTFKEGIEALAQKRGADFDTIVTMLRDFYDGYLFAEEGSRLYNPFSVLLALREKRIEPYWFETATPTFLAKRVKEYGLCLPDLKSQLCSRSDLISVGMGTGNPIGLMYQTGYLTIDHYDTRRNRYSLRFPNREVEVGFANGLYPLYVPRATGSNSPFALYHFQDDLFEGRPEDFMRRLQILCKEMPYEAQNEDNYRNIVWLLTTLCGTETLAERHSYRGRSDLEVKIPDFIYIFEFKYNESVEAAMSQLHERDYAGHYALNRRPVYLIGANFSSGKEFRGLTGWEIEELKKE